MLNANYNIYNLIIHDFFLIPLKLREESRFCLWKYESLTSSEVKLLKKPYGINSINQIIPSLKNSRYWFSLSKLKELSSEVKQEYGLGLVLNNSSYVVIDLDKCISKKNDKYLLSKEVKTILNLFPDAYIEISPSNNGIHIIFQGQWLPNCSKAKEYINASLNQGSIEVYSGNDCRYITLTGNSINPNLITNDLPYFSFEGRSLQKIYMQFFSKSKSSYFLHSSRKNLLIQHNSAKSSISNFNNIYLSIRAKILDSSFSQTYFDLCKIDNPSNKYKSTSEADWCYLSLVYRFLGLSQKCENQYNLLEFFLKKDRPQRDKTNRQDYIKITIDKILKNQVNKNTVFSNNSKQEEKDSSVQSINIYKVEKHYILRICNIMKIFHLGKPFKHCEYINQSNDNYVKAILPISLNENDLVYYIELLDQYASFIMNNIDCSNDEYIPININKILVNINKANSGRSHNECIKIVEKLSAVNLAYNKLINKEKLLYCKEGGSLLSYKYIYTKNSQIKFVKKYKKLYIKMHVAIYDILKFSDYNYSIFNKKSFDILKENKLKLLYYYFCISTLPGCFSKTFSIDDLLKLWPASKNRQTILKRKKNLYNFLKKIDRSQDKLLDLNLTLEKENNKIITVKVNKKKLNLT